MRRCRTVGKQFGHSLAEYALPAMDLFKRTARQGLSRARGNMAEYALPAMDLFKRTARQGLSRARGNMAEYALPAMLVGLVLFGGGALLLGDAFSLQGLGRQFQTATVQQTPNGQTALVRPSLGTVRQGRTIRFQLSNGRFVELSDVPGNIAQAVEVDGGHGTTERLIGVIEQLYAQLLASGDMTAAELAPLKNLAETSHRMAQAQKHMEDVASQCGNSKVCMEQGLFPERFGHDALGWHEAQVGSAQSVLSTYDASVAKYQLHPLTAKEWQGLELLQPGIRETLAKDPSFNYDPDNFLAGSVMASFLGQFADVNQLSYPSPAVRQLVQELTAGVYALTQTSLNAGSDAASYLSLDDAIAQRANAEGLLAKTLPFDHLIRQAEQMRNFNMPSLQNSVLTHHGAATLCHTGGGEDSGVQCK